MWHVRLRRLCHAGQSAFRGDLCLEERRLHEALEDEVSASWQRKQKNEVLATLERAEELRQLHRQLGMLLLSLVDSDCGTASLSTVPAPAASVLSAIFVECLLAILVQGPCAILVQGLCAIWVKCLWAILVQGLCPIWAQGLCASLGSRPLR